MSTGEKITLLAVDDDADIRTVLRANLGLHGFDVITAANLADAREVLKTTSPSLIILDLTLPDGDGLTFCEECKATHPQIPVIMLTARDKLQDKIIGLETGADDYVVKPFETCELLARIRARLRQTPVAGPARTICAGDLLVDIANHQATLRGEPVALTPKQFQLLTFLAENRGRLVTREEIRRTLWKDSPIYSWSRVIDVHIQHLRQKLEDDAAASKYIVTVLGQGYRFEG
jgi:DNA-binding response OmpR family regulator